jgi:gliding motility-associated-like protein
MKKIVTLIFLFVFFVSPKLFASHIIGGEMNYEYLGNDTFRITLKVYRDCGASTGFDDPAIIGIYSNGNLDTLISSFIFEQSFVDPPQLPSCVEIPTNVCVERAVYIEEIYLPPSEFGYDIMYQRCCRNGSIENITTPGSVGATYYAKIPPTSLANPNSNPSFNELPPIFLCINTPFAYDHSALDIDGDSLVYNLCTPYTGGTTFNPTPDPLPPPYGNVNWAGGFDQTNQLPSDIGLNLNVENGQITANPNALGQYVIGICVSEYRNGVLLGETKRDFQFNVIQCQNSVAAIAEFGAEDLCIGNTVAFSSLSSNSTNLFWDFGVTSLDSDTSLLPNPTYTFPDTGFYNVTLIAINGFTDCADTATAIYHVLPLLAPQVDAVADQCFDGNVFDFNLGGAFDASNASINWSFGSSANISSANAVNPPFIVYSQTGQQQVTVTVEQFGCIRSSTQTFNLFASPVAAIDYNAQLCGGLNSTFGNLSTGAVSYLWDFGVSGIQTDTSSLVNPNYQYPDGGEYQVTLISYTAEGCTDTANVTAFVTQFSPLTASITEGKNVLCEGDTVQVKVYASGGGPGKKWSTDGINFSTPSFYSFVVNSDTEVIVTVKDTCNAVVTDTSVFRTNTYNAVVANAYEDTTVCFGRRVSIKSSAMGGTGQFSYEWKNIAGSDQVQNANSDTTSLTVTVANTLVITAKDQCGTESSDTVDVKIKVCDVDVPNIFTPNGDASNNKFVIKGISDFPNTTVQIFDRWGSKVYETTNYTDEAAWDGSGRDTGTYFYLVNFSIADKTSIKGVVQLLR